MLQQFGYEHRMCKLISELLSIFLLSKQYTVSKKTNEKRTAAANEPSSRDKTDYTTTVLPEYSAWLSLPPSAANNILPPLGLRHRESKDAFVPVRKCNGVRSQSAYFSITKVSPCLYFPNTANNLDPGRSGGLPVPQPPQHRRANDTGKDQYVIPTVIQHARP